MIGLQVERGPGQSRGWQVVHEQSGLSLGFSVRLRRHAEAARGELYATGVNFDRPAGELRADLPRVGEVSSTWKRRADQCCGDDGEHYDPYTYAMEGRCSGGGKPRRS